MFQPTDVRLLNRSDWIYKETIQSVNHFKTRSMKEIDSRIQHLYKEWDLDRCFLFLSSSFGMFGMVFGFYWHYYFLFFTIMILSFMFQQSVQKWSPLIPILRALGFRRNDEIWAEATGLRFAKGDFENLSSPHDAPKVVEIEMNHPKSC